MRDMSIRTFVGIQPFMFTNPAEGEVLEAGQAITVLWTGGIPGELVNWALVDVEANAGTGSGGSIQNSGSLDWTVPESLPSGASCGRAYRFYIEDAARTRWQYGSSFRYLLIRLRHRTDHHRNAGRQWLVYQ